MASTLKINNLDTASGSTITIPTGKTLIGTDSGSIKAPGTVLQTQVNKYDTQVTTTSNSFAATGASVTITPRFATSHILVGIQGVLYLFGNSITQEPRSGFKLYRSEGGGSDAEIRSFLDSGGYTFKHEFGASNYWETHSFYFTHLHDVDTTSAVVYKLYWNNSGAQGFMRLNNGSANNSVTMTAMEIAQ